MELFEWQTLTVVLLGVALALAFRDGRYIEAAIIGVMFVFQVVIFGVFVYMARRDAFR